MKILNLYAGIGGNRKLWGNEHDITAVEFKPEIAKIYKDFYPNDTVIIEDAHQYLLNHFQEFDFIWSSPPCPSHSRMRMLWKGQKNDDTKVSGSSFKFPDMKLYEEILFLTHFFEGKWCVENVISYYDPLIPPVKADNHYFWTNFRMGNIENKTRGIRDQAQEIAQKNIGIDLSTYPDLSNRFKRDVIANCVRPETGLYILNCAVGVLNSKASAQTSLWNTEL